MPKHRTKKKSIRKRVKRNAKKVKELTAEDILLNPTLVQSPQFKALPIEKQFQLMNQVKQLKTMMGRTNGPVYASTGTGTDPALYSKVNDLNTKVSHQANENEQLRVTLDAQNKAYKREKQLNKDIKTRAQEQKDSIDQAARIEDLEQQKRRLDRLNEDNTIKNLEKQVKEKEDLAHAQSIKEKQAEQAKLNARIKIINQASKPASPLINIGESRIKAERIRQARDEKIDLQATLQDQINSLNENGNEAKTEQTEKILNSLNDNDVQDYKDDHKDIYDGKDESKKKPMDENEEIETVEEPNNNNVNESLNLVPPVEQVAINKEVILENQNQTRKEQIEGLEKVLKQQQQNKQNIELTLLKHTNTKPGSNAAKLTLEQEKARLIKEFEEFISKVPNPNPIFIKEITSHIQKASTFQDLNNIRGALQLDVTSQETIIKQQEQFMKKLNNLNKLRDENTEAYEKARGHAHTTYAFGFSSQTQLEEVKKQAFEALDELMNITEKPNEDYRQVLAQKIQHAQSIAEITPYHKKIAADLENMKREKQEYEQVKKERERLLAKFNKPKKSNQRFYFPSNYWVTKIYQAQTSDDINAVSNMMSVTRLNYGDKLPIEKMNKYRHSKLIRQESKEELIEKTKEFLREKPRFDKRPLFYDGELVKELPLEIQILSPSQDHILINWRTYEPVEKRKRKWYYLWLK